MALPTNSTFRHRCLSSKGPPANDFKRTPTGRIAIGLTAEDTHWAQFAFQLGTSSAIRWQTTPITPASLSVIRLRPTSGWRRALCETASLFTLHAMSCSCENAPPFPSWRNYAPRLNAYAEQRLTRSEHQLPAGKPFSVWFQENQAALRRNPMIRDWNTIIAIQLLPLFEAEPRGWQAVTFLNRGLHTPSDSLSKHLTEWRSQCPTDLRPFMTKFAAIFAIKL